MYRQQNWKIYSKQEQSKNMVINIAVQIRSIVCKSILSNVF